MFSAEQIQDIISHLPAKSKVHGFDTGDFSGDSLPDIALSLRSQDNDRRELSVHFFLNSPPGMRHVREVKRSYVNDPIEIGFSVDGGMCLVTSKVREMHWVIDGYTMTGQVFRRIHAWETQRATSALGHETQTRFDTWRTGETFYRISDARFLARNSFFTLPVFAAESRVPDGIGSTIGDTTSASVIRGASSWFGADDCAMLLHATDDSIWVVIDIDLRDERLLVTGDSASTDRLELWFDVGGGLRHETGRSGEEFRHLPFCLALSWMPAGAQPPAMVHRVETHDPALRRQLQAVQWSAVDPGTGRMEIRCRIPAAVFRGTRDPYVTGFTAVYLDHDNPDHPEWETVMATSDAFQRDDPVTFGAVWFVGDGSMFELYDVRLKDVIDRMARAGILF